MFNWFIIFLLSIFTITFFNNLFIEIFRRKLLNFGSNIELPYSFMKCNSCNNYICGPITACYYLFISFVTCYFIMSIFNNFNIFSSDYILIDVMLINILAIIFAYYYLYKDYKDMIKSYNNKHVENSRI